MPVLCFPQTMQAWKQRLHFPVSPKKCSVCPPCSHDHPGTTGQIDQMAIIVRANRIRRREHDGRIGRPKREQIGHAQGIVAPVLGKRDAATNCRIVFDLIGSARIEPDEHRISVAGGRAELPPKGVAIRSAR